MEPESKAPEVLKTNNAKNEEALVESFMIPMSPTVLLPMSGDDCTLYASASSDLTTCARRSRYSIRCSCENMLPEKVG